MNHPFRFVRAILLATPLLLVGCAQTLPIQGVQYRKSAAQYAQLGLPGSYGVALFSNSFLPDSSYVTFHNPIKTTLLTIDTDDSVRQAAVDASVNAPKVGPVTTGSASGHIDSKDQVNGRYNLIAITDNLPALINDSSNDSVKSVLLNWGKNARLVTSNAIAYGYDQIVTGSDSGKVSASYTAANGSLSLQGNRSHHIKLSDGTIFAYEMSKIYWKRDSKGNILVAAVIPDRPGEFIAPPPGTTDDPRNLK